MTEPIDQATKDLIAMEATLLFADNGPLKTGYIRGATVWAEKLKQERNKAIDELYELMDKELQSEPINRARYMIRLSEFRKSLKDKSHE